MTKEPNDESRTNDEEIEREVRSRRKFSIAEALGRSAGDLLKGASPVTRRRQAEFEVEEALERNLDDAEGALSIVLLRRVKRSEELLSEYERPEQALGRVVRRLLESEESLTRFVNRVDAEWGRLYLERPHFDRTDGPPDRDDPYTVESVRAVLEKLLDRLSETESSSEA